MPSDIKDQDESEPKPPEQGSEDDRKSPSANMSMEMTSHNMTSCSIEEEFKFCFDNNGSRYIPYSQIKQPTPPKESVKDNLPPYVFRSNAKLFMGVWHDTTEHPVIEIIEDMYESMDDVVITHANEHEVDSSCIPSTYVKLNSIDESHRIP